METHQKRLLLKLLLLLLLPLLLVLLLLGLGKGPLAAKGGPMQRKQKEVRQIEA